MPEYYYEITTLSGVLQTVSIQDDKCVAIIIDNDGTSTEIWANSGLYDTLNVAVGKTIGLTVKVKLEFKTDMVMKTELVYFEGIRGNTTFKEAAKEFRKKGIEFNE